MDKKYETFHIGFFFSNSHCIFSIMLNDTKFKRFIHIWIKQSLYFFFEYILTHRPFKLNREENKNDSTRKEASKFFFTNISQLLIFKYCK